MGILYAPHLIAVHLLDGVELLQHIAVLDVNLASVCVLLLHQLHLPALSSHLPQPLLPAQLNQLLQLQHLVRLQALQLQLVLSLQMDNVDQLMVELSVQLWMAVVHLLDGVELHLLIVA